MGKSSVKDVAKLSGVSLGTVDRVLNKRGNVSAKAVKAVEDAKQNPDIVNFLVGKVMQKTHGKADPELTLTLLKKNLGL